MRWRAVAARIVLVMVVVDAGGRRVARRAGRRAVRVRLPPGAQPEGTDVGVVGPRGPGTGHDARRASRSTPTGNPTPALWGQYGTAGLWWPVYDPGCNPAAEWGMRMATGLAQWGNEVTNFVLNTTAAVRSWAWRADWLGPIDDTMNTFTGGLRDTYTGPMMGVALVAAGLMIVWRGRRAQLSHTATLAGWAVAMMVLGVLAMSAPTRAAEFVDTYGIGAAGTVESAVVGRRGRGHAAAVPDRRAGRRPAATASPRPMRPTRPSTGRRPVRGPWRSARSPGRTGSSACSARRRPRPPGSTALGSTRRWRSRGKRRRCPTTSARP